MVIHSSILAWKYPADRGAWWAIVHGVSKSQIQLSWLDNNNKLLILMQLSHKNR